WGARAPSTGRCGPCCPGSCPGLGAAGATPRGAVLARLGQDEPQFGTLEGAFAVPALLEAVCAAPPAPSGARHLPACPLARAAAGAAEPGGGDTRADGRWRRQGGAVEEQGPHLAAAEAVRARRPRREHPDAEEGLQREGGAVAVVLGLHERVRVGIRRRGRGQDAMPNVRCELSGRRATRCRTNSTATSPL
ncbi:unnamed protein product, partial [Prorocentrum cordatum]